MPSLMWLWWRKIVTEFKLIKSSLILTMYKQDTYCSLLETYQQAKARGENVLLTLETKNCVETVQLTVSRPAGEPVAWRGERERGAWGIPASPPTDWRTPAGQEPETWRRSPGTGASGGAWAPPTPPTSRKKSPSQVRRDNVRSEVRRSSWKKKIVILWTK